MKIVLISARRDPFISPNDMDGGCVVLRNYVKELHKLGHEITIFTRLENEKSANTEKQKLKAKMQRKSGVEKVQIKNRLTVYRIPYKAEKNSDTDEHAQLKEAESFIQSLESYFNQEEYDIYHYLHLLSISGWYKIAGTIPYLEKSFFSPLLLTKGRSFEQPIEQRLQLERQVFEDIHYVISQSSGEVAQIFKYYDIDKNKIIKIPLGINEDIFYPKEKFKDLVSNKRLIIACPNSIKPQKKQLDLIKIASRLKEEGKQPLFLVIGNRPDKDYFNELINALKKSNLVYSEESIFEKEKLLTNNANIVFMDAVKEKKLAEILRDSDISLYPSTDEGFGLLIIDSMAVGTLPVCYELKSFKDYLLPGENAITCKEDEGWEGLAKNLNHLLDNREYLRDVAKTAVNVSHNFSWGNLIKNQVVIYSEILDNISHEGPVTFNLKNWINLHEG